MGCDKIFFVKIQGRWVTLPAIGKIKGIDEWLLSQKKS